MTNLNTRLKSVILALTMVVSGVFCAETATGFTSCMPNKKQVVVGLGFALWIRLYTKPNKDYKSDNWREDLQVLLNSYNIFDAESRAKIMELADKWIVGRKLAVIDTKYKEKKDEFGGILIKHDKQIKSKPFGLMGLIDAYIFIQLKKLNTMIADYGKMTDFMTKLE
jgi:hypothetical protein